MTCWSVTSGKGLYGGFAMKGGAISPDEDANRIYYEESASIMDILNGTKPAPTAAATLLTNTLDEHSKLPGKLESREL